MQMIRVATSGEDRAGDIAGPVERRYFFAAPAAGVAFATGA